MGGAQNNYPPAKYLTYPMEEENHFPNNLPRGYVSPQGSDPMSCFVVYNKPFFVKF